MVIVPHTHADTLCDPMIDRLKMDDEKHTSEAADASQLSGSEGDRESGPVTKGEWDVVDDVSGVFTQESVPKKRKVHMNDQECLDHSRTAKGALVLTNPEQVKTSSKDPNRGLYPRLPKCASHKLGSFVSAREMMDVGADNLLKASQSESLPYAGPVFPTKRGSPVKGRKNLDCTSQRNKVSNYFSAAPQPSLAPQDGGQNFGISSAQPHSQSPLKKTSKMYSPIKKVPGAETLYEVDLTASPLSSQSSPHSSQGSVDVVKVLFDSQQAAASSSQHPKAKKGKKREPKFNRDNTFLYSNDSIPGTSVSAPETLNDPYGLLGSGDNAVCLSSDEEEEPVNHFARLPVEVVENIFCYLPLMDLLLNVNRVCKNWNAVISNDRVA